MTNEDPSPSGELSATAQAYFGHSQDQFNNVQDLKLEVHQETSLIDEQDEIKYEQDEEKEQKVRNLDLRISADMINSDALLVDGIIEIETKPVGEFNINGTRNEIIVT